MILAPNFSPLELKQLSLQQLPVLANEVREDAQFEGVEEESEYVDQ